MTFGQILYHQVNKELDEWDLEIRVMRWERQFADTRYTFLIGPKNKWSHTKLSWTEPFHITNTEKVVDLRRTPREVSWLMPVVDTKWRNEEEKFALPVSMEIAKKRAWSRYEEDYAYDKLRYGEDYLPLDIRLWQQENQAEEFAQRYHAHWLNESRQAEETYNANTI